MSGALTSSSPRATSPPSPRRMDEVVAKVARQPAEPPSRPFKANGRTSAS
jgi:hypothetical protein